MSFSKFLPKLTNKKTPISTSFSECLTKTLDTKNKRPIRLRASGLPKCSLHFLSQFLIDEFDKEEAMMDYYCSVGTTVHTHVQKWMGTTGKVFGNWKCHNCGHYVEKSVKHLCPKCKSVMEYVELEVEHDVFSGHIDGLYKLPNGKFIVFDYKTSSTMIVSRKKFIPIAKHLMQVAAYGAVLTLEGYEIDSLSIFYITRDDPKQNAEYNIPYTKELHEHTIKFLKQQIQSFKAGRKAFKTKNFELAYKYKMCSSYHEYKSEYEKFFGLEPCELATICFNKSVALDYLNNL